VDYGVRTYAVQGVGLPIPGVKEDKQLSVQGTILSRYD